MASIPVFEYYVGQPSTPIRAADEQWAKPIVLHRPRALIDPSVDDGATVTYGDYFIAARDFLSADDMAVPRRVIQGLPGWDRAPDGIRIHLVKHGALYHPACVTLVAGHRQARMVLNVAVGAEGRARLPAEVGYLEQLHGNLPEAFVPEPYGGGTGRTARQDPLPMFAAQWFDDYHEVHRTDGVGSGPQQWVVWDSGTGAWYLSEAQVSDFFRQAVFILTYYFDPHTLGTIMEWHHAAGDFIVKRNTDERLDVRLITVRRYGPMFHLTADDNLDLNTLLDALTIFFLRVSLWMRLDRLEGVDTLVWSHDTTLQPMWEGFIQGLERMARLHHFPEQFVAAVVGYIARHDADDLRRMGLQILERYPEDLPEAVLIKQHLQRHAACLAALIQRHA